MYYISSTPVSYLYCAVPNIVRRKPAPCPDLDATLSVCAVSRPPVLSISFYLLYYISITPVSLPLLLCPAFCVRHKPAPCPDYCVVATP
jgi:hypothetical protein